MPVEWLVERANVTQSWKKGRGRTGARMKRGPGLRLLGVE